MFRAQNSCGTLSDLDQIEDLQNSQKLNIWPREILSANHASYLLLLGSTLRYTMRRW
jgi:hypothetical protein